MNRNDVESVKCFQTKNPESKVKAMVTVNFANGLSIKGFKVVNGQKGLFMGLPSVKNDRAERGWEDLCFCRNKEDWKELNDIVIEAYKAEFGESTGPKKTRTNKKQEGWEDWTNGGSY